MDTEYEKSSTTEPSSKYTEDDLYCFENLQWEMGQLSEFLKDCNHRKITYFKISLGLLSVLITVFGIMLHAVSREFDFSSSIEAQLIVAAITIAVSLLNYTIVKELFSIHSSRVHVIRQMNCLRQAMDSLRYKKHMGEYPLNAQDLKQTQTQYWESFGKHRKLQIENSCLRNSEESLKSPDFFMIIVLISTSLLIQIGYFTYKAISGSSKLMSFGVGVFVTFIIISATIDVVIARKDLREKLGHNSKEGI
jgi:hypothetical protein